MQEKTSNSSLLSRWKNRSKEAGTQEIAPAPKDAIIPLSPGQERLWFLQKMYPDNPFYNYAEAYVLKGNLDVERFKKSIEIVYASHAILRSLYPDTSGKPSLEISDKIDFPFNQIHVEEEPKQNIEERISELMLLESRFNFQLSTGPLFRVLLIQKSASEYIAVFTLHHIITDKWSMGLFRKAVSATYEKLSQSAALEPQIPPIQYTDFAFSQQDQNINTTQLEYWKEQLRDTPSKLELPFTNYQRQTTTFRGKHLSIIYSEELSKKLLGVAQDLAVTPYVLLLTAFYTLLWKYTTQNDIIIGSPVSNRDKRALEELIGFFNDTVILRTKIGEGATFKELVTQVRQTTLEAFANKDIPFDSLVKELNPNRDLSANPFFNVMFLYHSVEPTPDFGGELSLEHYPIDTQVSKFDLTLYIAENDNNLSAIFEYATDLFTEATIAQMHTHFESILKAVVAHPDERLDYIQLLGDSEQQMLYPEHSFTYKHLTGITGIHSQIEKIAQENPNSQAVVFKEHSLTYQELNSKATLLAHKILETAKPASMVGLHIGSSLDMIIGLVGILKAGCAYLPLDPNYPESRIRFMLEDSQTTTVVTTTEGRTNLATWSGNLVNLDTANWNNNTNDTVLPEVDNESLAYVIYTSGSSGKPKGVPISHENILASTEARFQYYEKAPDTFLLLSSISFDSSKAGIFWTLCAGGTLVIAPKRIEQDMEQMGNLIASQNISHTLLLPTLYQLVLEHISKEKLQNLKTVVVAGEKCDSGVLQKHFDKLATTALYNEYGPTEATVWCTAHRIRPEDIHKDVPIGKETPHANIYILDTKQEKVASGMVGEIYVGGQGLSKGYINRKELTASRFVTVTIDGTAKQMYKTGDLGRYRRDGSILFLGRADQQVKIRGYRVELTAVETALKNQVAISDASVIPDHSGNRLIAYVEETNGSNFNLEEIRATLKTKLPEYMVPSKYLLIDQIPKLPNGKLDRLALDALPIAHTTETKAVVPQNEIQQQLADLWKTALKLDSVGIHDNFFEIGGDSILSIQIISKAKKQGLPLRPNLLFRYQTISELAKHMENQSISIETRTPETGETPLFPIQHWYFEEHCNAPHFWNQAYRINATEGLTTHKLRAFTQQVWEKHDALRLHFFRKNETLQATIAAPDQEAPYELWNCSQQDKEQQKTEIEGRLKQFQEQLDLEKDTLFKCIGIMQNEDEIAAVIFWAHHLVIDAVSWDILLADFFDTKENKWNISNNKPKSTTSIKQWGQHLYELSRSEKLKSEEAYWNEQLTKVATIPRDFDITLPCLEEQITTVSVSFEEKLTGMLQSSALEAYGNKVEELLITAVTLVLADWTNTSNTSLLLERHGRETLDHDLDLSDTIGWFTAFFPCLFNLCTGDYGKSLMAVKDKMRTIPNGGIGYGIHKYISQTLKPEKEPEVVFNYLGVRKNRTQTEFYPAAITRHPKSERNYLLEINSFITADNLQFHLSYSNKAHKKESIDQFVLQLQKTLKAIVAHCMAQNERTYTPTDFKETDMSQNDLDNLMNELEF